MNLLFSPPFADLQRSGNRTKLLRFAIMIAVFVAALFFGIQPSAAVAAALVALICGIIVSRYPGSGLVVLLICAMSIPFSINTGTRTNINIALIITAGLLASWFVYMFLRHKMRLVPSQANLPLIGLAISATVSLVAGAAKWHYAGVQAPVATQIGGWFMIVLSFGLTLYVGNRIRNTVTLKLIIVILIAAALLVSASRYNQLAAELTGALIREDLGVTGSMFWVWAISFSTGMALFNTHLKSYIRLLLIAISGLMLLVGYLLLGDWKSGWVPPLLCVAILFILRFRKAGFAMVVIAVALGLLNTYSTANLIIDEAYSIDTREAAWTIIIEHIIPLSPIIGIGIANYYYYVPLYPILGYTISFNSHNQYIDLLAQMGFLGLAMYLWLFATLARMAWVLRINAQEGFARAYAFCCLAGIAGTLWSGVQGDWVLPFVYNIGFDGFRASMLPWLFFGGLIAVEHLTKQHMTLTDTTHT